MDDETLERVYRRLPTELQRDFDALPEQVRRHGLEELQKFHLTMEEQVYRFVLEFIRLLKGS